MKHGNMHANCMLKEMQALPQGHVRSIAMTASDTNAGTRQSAVQTESLSTSRLPNAWSSDLSWACAQGLRQRIRDSYEARWKAEKHFDEEEIMQELPNSLRTEVGCCHMSPPKLTHMTACTALRR